MKKLPFSLSLLASILLASCGGVGGSDSSGVTAGAVVADSAYIGQDTVQGAQTLNVVGAVASGVGLFADSKGFVYVMPAIPSSGSITGTLAGFAPQGFAFAAGGRTQAFSLTGTASGATASSIVGSFTGGGENGTFNLTAQATTTPTLAGLAGSYSGFYFGTARTSITLTLNSFGSFVGQDALGCSITGTVASQTGNLFLLAVDSSGSGCPGVLAGLAFEVTSDLSDSFGGAAGTYLYLGGSNSTTAFAAELQHN